MILLTKMTSFLDDALAFIHGDGDVVNLSLNYPFLPRS
jgi:hypothetical protein